MVCGRNVQRDECLQRRVAVGLGVGGVGFGLRRFALRDAVMLQQILVQVGKPAVGLRGGERLLISADGRRKIGRIHRRQRIALLDPLAERNQQPRYRTGEGRQHAGGLIVVEIDRAGGLDRLVKFGRLDRVEVDVLPLGRRQRHIARPSRRDVCGLVVRLARTAGSRPPR